MAIKFGASIGDIVKSFRIGSTDSPLICNKDVTPYITNVTLTLTERKTICFDPTIVDLPENFCFDTITYRITARTELNWVAKLNASSDWAAGSVLNKIGCPEGIYLMYYEVNLTANGRGDNNAITDLKSILTSLAAGDDLLGAYDIINDASLIKAEEDKDIPLNDWERATVTFRGFSMTGRGMVETPVNYNGTFNVDRGTAEIVRETTFYDTSDEHDYATVINILKSRAGIS
ncbi:MAG TPA: hypothetical protein ENG63_07695 [Candidatus Desulfofervidus auxilii]|uniref:Uncharacterized protein n=1 Tax=Desulfofervidus auxilii TaxID=1621989 RepID=A0A7C0U358_DESA2|nr:hypothetical protein [Candidatus Desulfofervidus auxilii]